MPSARSSSSQLAAPYGILRHQGDDGWTVHARTLRMTGAGQGSVWSMSNAWGMPGNGGRQVAGWRSAPAPMAAFLFAAARSANSILSVNKCSLGALNGSERWAPMPSDQPGSVTLTFIGEQRRERRWRRVLRSRPDLIRCREGARLSRRFASALCGK